MPDVVIWMISGQKRIAYHRIPANDILFAPEVKHRGRDCGKLQTIQLKVNSGNLLGQAQSLLFIDRLLCRLEALTSRLLCKLEALISWFLYTLEALTSALLCTPNKKTSRKNCSDKKTSGKNCSDKKTSGKNCSDKKTSGKNCSDKKTSK